jgi:hypothetical protein
VPPSRRPTPLMAHRTTTRKLLLDTLSPVALLSNCRRSVTNLVRKCLAHTKVHLAPCNSCKSTTATSQCMEDTLRRRTDKALRCITNVITPLILLPSRSNTNMRCR